MIYIIPFIIIFIICFGAKNKISVYNVFCEGVEEGAKTVFSIFPVILAITVGVGVMRASGLMDFLISFIAPFFNKIGFPKEILPLVLVRPFSGGASLGVLADILKEYHPDSFVGFCACVVMGSCETTFYTLMTYFKNTRVKYVKHIIPAAVFGDIVGIGAGVLVSSIFF